MKAKITCIKPRPQIAHRIGFTEFSQLKFGVIYKATPAYATDEIHYVSRLNSDKVVILACLLSSGEVKGFCNTFNVFSSYYDNFELMPPGFSITLTQE